MWKRWTNPFRIGLFNIHLKITCLLGHIANSELLQPKAVCTYDLSEQCFGFGLVLVLAMGNSREND